MNKVSGKIVVRESGIGIPDLLVVFYDVDPHTKPEEVISNLVSGSVTASASNNTPGVLGDRLGSVLTGVNGAFELSDEDDAFRVRNAQEARPDLLLLVLAPEENRQSLEARVLYAATTDIRQNAGRTEQFMVRLEAAQLEKAGIALPTTAPEEVEAAPSLVARLTAVEVRDEEIAAGIIGIAKTRVEVSRSRFKGFRAAFKPALQKTLSRVPAALRDPARLVAPGESVFQKSADVARRNINQIVNSDDPRKRAPVRGFLTLTTAERDELRAAAGSDGSVPANALERVLARNQTTGTRTTFLQREDPLHVCRDAVTGEGNCVDLLSDDSQNQPDGEPEPALPSNGNVTGAGVDTIVADDIPHYLARLMDTMTSPEEQVLTGLTPRATQETVLENIKSLSFKTSPADVPAFHDFYSLQIAFEHVWQEAIDEGLLDLAEDAYQTIVELGGDPDADQDGESDPLRKLMVEGHVVARAHGISVRDHRRRPVHDHRTSSSGSVRDHRTSSGGTVRDHRTSSGDVVRDHRSRGGSSSDDDFDPAEHLPEVLQALEQRLKEEYAFTVYAANRKERSVNFAVLVTYRRLWTPLAYQAGRLVKSIPLAPKQMQKVVITRKLSKKRSQKEVEQNLTNVRAETSETSRAEQEIVRRASVKTNFSVTAQESMDVEVGPESSVTAAFSREANKSSDDTKKSFHEAVFKAAQEFKHEHTTEINVEETEDFESVETTEISNPNDEIAVTFLFYELQRRYRVTETIHRVQPVVLVAQEVPEPQEIDEDWILTYDWILRRVLLDDSFLPALNYLRESIVGDEIALEVMRHNIEQQREIVDKLQEELVAARQRANLQRALLERAIYQSAGATGDDGNGGGLFGVVSDVVDVATDAASAVVGGAADFLFGGSDATAGQTRLDAMENAAQRSADEARDLLFRLEREVTALNALTESYSKALSAHLNQRTQIARLQVHLKQNLLYYMQAIWSHEPADQRFFRLHEVPVPTFRVNRRSFKVDFASPQATALAPVHQSLPRFGGRQAAVYPFEVKTEIDPEMEFMPLSQAADLDNLLGFKGNYMIFPLQESNVLTDYMMDPYVDRAFGQIVDPADPNNWTLEEFSQYVCCLKDVLTAQEFASVRTQLAEQYGRLLAAPRRTDDILVIPTDSVFIEALPAAHSLIEDFKAQHRAIDVKKVQAEVRKMELENIRLTARLLAGEREDPDIESVKQVFLNNTDMETTVDVGGDT